MKDAYTPEQVAAGAVAWPVAQLHPDEAAALRADPDPHGVSRLDLTSQVPGRIERFIRYRDEHLTGDEKGEAQLFLENL